MRSRKNKFDQQLDLMLEQIVRNFKPERVILFGSRATGSVRPESDVDLLIVQNSTLPRRARARAIRSRLFPPSLPVDLFVYTPREIEESKRRGDFFIREALKKGKIVYAKS